MNLVDTLDPPRRLTARTIAGIVIGNLIPVFGVLFLGWDAGAILILYWIENLIVGAFTLPRILTAQGPPPAPGSVISGTPFPARLALGAFFCVHYGLFWAVHGVFAFLLAASFGHGGTEPFAGMGSPEQEAARVLDTGGWSFWLGVAALVAIHAYGFWRGWIRSGLWRTSTPNAEMFRPYGRLFVLHITVLLGAFGLASVGAPAWTMILLCVGKMIIELGAEIASTRPQRRVDQST